jgi:hypothetical protein
MDILHFNGFSFPPDTIIGYLHEKLNNILGQGIYYDTFKIQNAKWLWLVNDVVTIMNNDKILRGAFGLYPIFVAGILISVKDINFYVLGSEKLNYANYTEQCIADKKCTISHAGNYFQLSYGGETIVI